MEGEWRGQTACTEGGERRGEKEAGTERQREIEKREREREIERERDRERER